MNALKKAETAKQAGEGAPSAATAPAAAESGRNLTQELGLDPPATRNAGVAQAATAPVLPDAGPALMPMELMLEPDVTPVAPPATPSARDAPRASSGRVHSAQDAGRSGARAVFSAKQSPAAGSKAPFYGLIGLCLMAGAAYGFYLWMQMQPPARPPVAAVSALQNRAIANAANAANAADAAGAAGAAGASNAANTAISSPATDAAVITAQTATEAQVPAPERSSHAGSTSRNSPAPDASVTPAPLAQRSGQSSVQMRREAAPVTAQNSSPPAHLPRRADAASAAGGAEVESPANLRITRNANLPAINADVLTGYAALQAGDLDRAGQAYDRALRSEPANRDALLGAATVLLRLDRTDAAEAYFRQLLRLHPHDTYATAQLAALTARGDPVGALSQVNSLIAREADRPENATGQGALAFVQGNQLAAQGRWPEAQQAYFNAHRADPANADYCYNLAVSLDRMHEPRLARDFYRKALDMARGRAAGFDPARAQTRLGQIDGALK